MPRTQMTLYFGCLSMANCRFSRSEAFYKGLLGLVSQFPTPESLDRLGLKMYRKPWCCSQHKHEREKKHMPAQCPIPFQDCSEYTYIYIYIYYTYIPYHTIPYHTTPHHTTPYHTITLHCIALHCIPLHYITYIQTYIHTLHNKT